MMAQVRKLTANERRRSKRIEDYLVKIGVFQDNPWARIFAQLVADDFIRDGITIRDLKAENEDALVGYLHRKIREGLPGS